MDVLAGLLEASVSRAALTEIETDVLTMERHNSPRNRDGFRESLR
jgi:hypothetical protein